VFNLVFNQADFNDFILRNKVIGFFNEPIKLKSGRMSNWYVNWRTVVEDVYLMDQLSDFVLDFIKAKNIKVDCLYGVPEGATKLGILSQFKLAKSSDNYSKGSHILAMGRAKPKDHGAPKDRFFVGMPQGDVVILEDVTTTGMSLLSTIDSLKQANVNIVAAIGLTNRMELRDDKKSVEQAVKEKGVEYFSMSTALELLPSAYKADNPGEAIAKNIENEFKEYGVQEIKLK
jgi:orotate phosphoribosyltransferase